VRVSGQAMADGKGCCRSPVFARCLVEDVGQVVRNRFLAQSQFFGDLVVRQPFRHQA
jgi:hypothetical protein